MICVLAGCDSPGLGYQGAEVTRLEIEGYSFSIRRKGNVAQVIRTNFLRRPDIDHIGRVAERAIETTYGCHVEKMSGDVALMVGLMDCSRGASPQVWATWVRPKRSQMSCIGHFFSAKDIDVFRCI